MKSKIFLCNKSAIALGSTKYFKYGIQQGILVHDETGFHAFKNFCTHMGGPLRAAGKGLFECQWHESQFSSVTGEALPGGQAPVGTKLPVIELVIEGDAISYIFEPLHDPFND